MLLIANVDRLLTATENLRLCIPLEVDSVLIALLHRFFFESHQ